MAKGLAALSKAKRPAERSRLGADPTPTDKAISKAAAAARAATEHATKMSTSGHQRFAADAHQRAAGLHREVARLARAARRPDTAQNFENNAKKHDKAAAAKTMSAVSSETLDFFAERRKKAADAYGEKAKVAEHATHAALAAGTPDAHLAAAKAHRDAGDLAAQAGEKAAAGTHRKTDAQHVMASLAAGGKGPAGGGPAGHAASADYQEKAAVAAKATSIAERKTRVATPGGSQYGVRDAHENAAEGHQRAADAARAAGDHTTARMHDDKALAHTRAAEGAHRTVQDNEVARQAQPPKHPERIADFKAKSDAAMAASSRANATTGVGRAQYNAHLKASGMHDLAAFLARKAGDEPNMRAHTQKSAEHMAEAAAAKPSRGGKGLTAMAAAKGPSGSASKGGSGEFDESKHPRGSDGKFS